MAVIPRSDTRPRLPKWFKRSIVREGASAFTERVLREQNLVTVCEEASCPNRNECYSKKVTTFMLMGEACTRTCSFCDVETKVKGLPELDPTEPERVAIAAGRLALNFVVLTSVNRDDLPLGGADHFAACITALRQRNPKGKVEVLTPDFCGEIEAIDRVVAAAPDVYNHNVETVSRLYRVVRPQATYQRSLDLLAHVKQRDPRIWTKSGMMVGLGESDDEVRWLMEDLRKHQVDIFTVGQYLRPSLKHHDIMRFVPPEQFERYKEWGLDMGFAYVAAGPYVRSSHFAEEVLAGAVQMEQS